MGNGLMGTCWVGGRACPEKKKEKKKRNSRWSMRMA